MSTLLAKVCIFFEYIQNPTISLMQLALQVYTFTDCTVDFVADWDNASLSNETLLDTVSRFVLAALLKHTGLLGQACGEGR